MRIKGCDSINQPPRNIEFSRDCKNPSFKQNLFAAYESSAVYLLRPPHSFSSDIAAAVGRPWITTGDFLHPLTLQQQRCNRPINFSLSKFRKSTLAVYHRPHDGSFDKVLFLPKPKSISKKNSESDYDDGVLVLYGGGRLSRRTSGKSPEWVELSGVVKFDDLTLLDGKVYALDRLGRVYLITNLAKSWKLKFGETLISQSIVESERIGWRKRFVVDGNELYLVVRMGEKFFRVYKMLSTGNSVNWEVVRGFDEGKVLFMARDCYFFTRAKAEFPGTEYENCIVFSEAAFPQYGKNCWEFTRQLGYVLKCEDDVAVFRLSDGAFAREGEKSGFPRIIWSPPPWVLQVSAGFGGEVQPRSVSYSSESGREFDKDERMDSSSRDEMDMDRRMQSDIKDSDNEDVQDSIMIVHDHVDEETQCDTNNQKLKVAAVHSDENIMTIESLEEDARPSLSEPESDESTDHVTASVSTEEDTRTLISRNSETQEETSRKKIRRLVPKVCTSSKIESHKSSYAVTKFEGLDIRSDLVPILQKIWRKHGNVIKNSSMRSGDIIAMALESLATVVRILDENSAESLRDCQADYLTSTLSDLRCIRFNVSWLIPFVERAVQLRKSKPFVDSLNNLTHLSSHIKERKAILLDDVAKLREEENKLTEVMAKVSKMIPFSGEVKLDEPVGSGLT